MTTIEELRQQAEKLASSPFGTVIHTPNGLLFRAANELEALQRENGNLNKALSLKLDAMPSGLSAGQSMKMESEIRQLRLIIDGIRQLVSETVPHHAETLPSTQA